MVGNARLDMAFFQLYRDSTVIGFAYGTSYSTSVGLPSGNYDVRTLATTMDSSNSIVCHL